MATPAEGLALRPPVGQMLSESFAVIAHRQQTLAVSNGPKFRGVLLIFGCETLFSRPTFVTIRPPFGSMGRFWAMRGRTMAEVGYEVALSSTPGECSAKPLMVSCRPNGKPFMAKRQTFLTKHNLLHAFHRPGW